MNPTTGQLISALHQSPCKCVLVVTGGGMTAVADLLSVPGGSRTVLEASVPYDGAALAEYLRRLPESFCSAETARAVGARAYDRATWLAPDKTVVGLGCTASLATNRPKRGEHRCHVAARTAEGVAVYSLVLTKGARDRSGEERVVSDLLLNALAAAFGVPDRIEVSLMPGECVQTESCPNPGSLERFFCGEIAAVCVEPDGRGSEDAVRPGVLLSGAFNPVHEGHWGLAKVAQRFTGMPVSFELSVINADKAALSPEEVRCRLAPFAWRAPIWLTRAPTFAAKAQLLPRAIFVVGVDTAARIVHPRYYHDGHTGLTDALARIRGHGCRFLVAGRVDQSGTFRHLADVPVPDSFGDLFTAIPESEFRMALSSTKIRQQHAQSGQST